MNYTSPQAYLRNLSTFKMRLTCALLIVAIAMFSFITLQRSDADSGRSMRARVGKSRIVRTPKLPVTTKGSVAPAPKPLPVITPDPVIAIDTSESTTELESATTTPVIIETPGVAPGLTPAAAIAAQPSLQDTIIQSFLDQVAIQFDLQAIKLVSYKEPTLIVKIYLKPQGSLYIAGTATIDISQAGVVLKELTLQADLKPLP